MVQNDTTASFECLGVYKLEFQIMARYVLMVCIQLDVLSGRWQALAAVLPEGPYDIGDSHLRALKWPKHASPRARGRAGSVSGSACDSATKGFSRFSPKSRFS